MTSSSSKPPARAAGAAPARPANPYARFIPREELHGFAAWTPESLGGEAAAAGAPEADLARAGADLEARLASARQDGYRDGTRDGLAALEGLQRSHALQVSAQAAALLQAIDEGFQALEERLAQATAATAVTLARQVLRAELGARPERVARVAAEAVAAVLASARRVELHLHPQDLPLVAQSAAEAEAIAARGTRLIADETIARGGCRVESDLGRIDARIESRWAQAAAALGVDLPWADAGEPA